LGVIFSGVFGPRISLRTVALLVIAMALGIGTLELAIARTLRRHRRLVDGWWVRLAGAVSVGFALWFLALVFGLIRLEPGSHLDFVWFGSYFGLTAISMFVLARRLHGLGGPSGRLEVLPPLDSADTRRQHDRDNPSDPFTLMSESLEVIRWTPRGSDVYRGEGWESGTYAA
jgi:hypothetical protein